MNEFECSLCGNGSTDDMDLGEYCSECRAPLCYNCSMAFGYCESCADEYMEDFDE